MSKGPTLAEQIEACDEMALLLDGAYQDALQAAAATLRSLQKPLGPEVDAVLAEHRTELYDQSKGGDALATDGPDAAPGAAHPADKHAQRGAWWDMSTNPPTRLSDAALPAHGESMEDTRSKSSFGHEAISGATDPKGIERASENASASSMPSTTVPASAASDPFPKERNEPMLDLIRKVTTPELDPSPQPSVVEEFSRWWGASKYCQVALGRHEQVALDAWTAASKRASDEIGRLKETIADYVKQYREDFEHIAALEAELAAAQKVPREPTEVIQQAGLEAMFDESGDLKRRELLKIVRKGWRAMYDAAQLEGK